MHITGAPRALPERTVPNTTRSDAPRADAVSPVTDRKTSMQDHPQANSGAQPTGQPARPVPVTRARQDRYAEPQQAPSAHARKALAAYRYAGENADHDTSSELVGIDTYA